jgi:hypothetical protein
MTRIVQFRRGTSSGLSTILGAPGELFVDTSLSTVVVHDGVTTGGVTLARNADLTAINSNLNTVSSNILAAHTYTTTQTFAGSNTSISSKFYAAAEYVNVVATSSTGVINFDILTQSILYHTLGATASWILNFRANSTTSLNSIMNTGDSIGVAFMATQGATAYLNTSITIDGTANSILWQGGSAPTNGNASSVDLYSYTIVKTASSTHTVLASQTQFK